jgi:hypothetical protein
MEYRMSTPLWELLIKIKELEKSETLTCSEYFAVIELLAQGARLGIDLERLEKLARDHLGQCLDCQDQILKRLDHLEGMAN